MCFFHSLQTQAEALKDAANSLEDIIDRVTQAYTDYSTEQLSRVHALNYVVYRCILVNEGHNQYDMPHTGIRNRQSNGMTVEDCTVDGELVRQAKRMVDNYEVLA